MAKKPQNLKLKIVQALRKVFLYSDARREALSKARVTDDEGVTYYRCAKTKKLLPKDAVKVDHIDPVVDPEKGFVDWNSYIDRLFCSADGLQIISKKAHDKKTKEENTRRKVCRISRKKKEKQ